MPERMWGGRFAREPDPRFLAFGRSLGVDRRLFPYEIRASIAHARGLGRAGVLTPAEVEALTGALQELGEQVTRGEVELPAEAEDVHTAVESLLVERVGDLGRKLHTGRSRNDQVATDLRLYLKDAAEALTDRLRDLVAALLEQAWRHRDTILPGYTHLQRAQPVLLAHHLLAYVEMLERDRERLAGAVSRADWLPLGAGALAGTPYPVDREAVARELGFAGACRNSLDAVADRDFVLETLGVVAILMVHLSRLAEEVVLWTTREFAFLELDDAWATGSSLLPQKKNPDGAELVRARAGRVAGRLAGLLAVMKGLPLSYNRDLQEDKEALFDGVDTALASLEVMAGMLRSARFDPRRMRLACGQGHLTATDLADCLVRAGVPFREAHAAVGRAVLAAEASGRDLAELSREELATLGPPLAGMDPGAISVEASVASRAEVGGTAPARVRDALEAAARRWGVAWPPSPSP